MITPIGALGALCLYMAVLFAVAVWAARRSKSGRSVVDTPLVYSLGLTVLCTTWTFYGSVGKAASIGMMFLVPYLGIMMPLFFWWTIVRKMVRIKAAYKITSIADFISARYEKSAGLAALVTVFCLIGVMPYIALQIKAITYTFRMVSSSATGELSLFIRDNVGVIITLLMIVFTVMFGVRSLDPTERHPGMVMAIAIEGVIKLAAFLAVGLFVTYHLYGGVGDIFHRLRELPWHAQLDLSRNDPRVLFAWLSNLIIASLAVMFLPRQFHMTVIENSDENHVKTAMWMLPAYILLFTIFTFPLAVAGLLSGLPVEAADTFVLRLPLEQGNQWLALIGFLGGFSAASGMIMIGAMTLSTMLTNHLLLPLMEWLTPLRFLRRHLLECKWAGVALTIGAGFLFERAVGASYMLVSMGVISFAAASQLAPAMLGAMFWRKGNRCGAFAGLIAGFSVWGYTMVLPAFCRSGWISANIIELGPWGIGFLKPEQLFGLSSFDPLANTVFWSLALNVFGYVMGSTLSSTSPEGKRLADDFVSILEPKQRLSSRMGQERTIDIGEKILLFENLLSEYFSPPRTRRALSRCRQAAGLDGKHRISIMELAELHNEVERTLAGAIGAAAARSALKRKNIFNPEDSGKLSAEYAAILADLKIAPEELKRKVDYYQEREALLSRHAADLETKIAEREEEIRQRKRVEEKLRQAEEKYRSIFENAVEGIFQTTPDGRFLSVNRALARMLGYDSPEDLMVSVTDIKRQLYVNPERRDDFVREIEKSSDISGFVAQFYRKDGKKMWASLNSHSVYGREGDILYFEGTFQDITAQKHAQEEKARLEDELRQAQKMEAVGRLAGGVAHDFNNLLTAMIGYANLLMQEIPSGSAQHDKLVRMVSAAQRAASLTQQLLAFSRKQMLDVRILDLNAVIGELEGMLRPIIGEDIDLVLELAPSLATTRADPGRIHQIILNLAVNARDAMPRGGTLRITTANINLSEEKAAELGDVSSGSYVMLSMRDTGHGISKDILSRIFEPFFTTKPKGVGTGLGLSTVYGIVKQHKGHVIVESEPEKGAAFHILLPASCEPAEPAPEASFGLPLLQGKETILVVEDEEIVRELACEALDLLGYTALSAGDADEALAIGKNYKKRIDLLLTDVVLPQMDGKTLYERFSRIRPHTKVLFVSGYTEDAIVRHGVLDAGVHFLAKPFTVDLLAAKIRDILDSASSPRATG
ncbi:MAG: ATP-binding protein [Thermodesulfobacteriota bacterium]